MTPTEAMGAYLYAWRRKNRGSEQGEPTLTIAEHVRVKNDVFDIVVSVEQLQRMTRDMLTRA